MSGRPRKTVAIAAKCLHLQEFMRQKIKGNYSTGEGGSAGREAAQFIGSAEGKSSARGNRAPRKPQTKSRLKTPVVAHSAKASSNPR